MPGWAGYGGQAQVLTARQDGGDQRLAGQEGQVVSLGWSSQLPGGDMSLQMAVAMSDRRSSTAFEAGRLVQAYRGGVVWRGTMAEPSPRPAGGWDLTAQGEGSYGNNFRATFGSPAQPNNMITSAVGRGLRWTRVMNLDGVPGMDLTQVFEDTSRTVTEALNAYTAGGTLTWAVNRDRARIEVFPMPRITAPTRLLVTADPPGRTLNGFYTGMFVRFQLTEDQSGQPAAYSWVFEEETGRRGAYGALEGNADYSQAGVMTAGTARNYARGLLNAYQARAYTQTLTVTPGMVLTLGGTPVDLGTERAGEVYRVISSETGAEADLEPVAFLGGKYDWDDFAQAARIEPYQFISQDFSALVTAMAPPPPPQANLG
jgi:hypothetical protein